MANKEFQDLLRDAIGPRRTQAEFAREAGLSKAQISRLLSQKQVSQPQIATLKKIAGHAYGGITLRDLMAVCGYSEDRINQESDTEAQRRKKLPLRQRVEEFADDFRKGISDLCAYKTIYKSILDFLDTLNMIYTGEDTAFDIRDSNGFVKDERFPNAEEACCVSASFEDGAVSAEIIFVLFYAQTKGGSVIIFGAAFDMNTYDKYSDTFIRGFEEIEDKKGNLIIARAFDKSKKYIPDKKEANRCFRERVEYFKKIRGMKENDAWLAAMFGDPDKPKRPMSVEGIGFYTDKVSEYKIRAFLEKHLDSIPDKGVVEKMLYDNGSICDAFKNSKYTTMDHASSNHWSCAVVDIISKETDIGLEVYEDEEGIYPYKNRSCLVFPEDYPWSMNETEQSLGQNTLYQILDKYARELGCEVEECYFIIEADA